jgi:hypothetical protein
MKTNKQILEHAIDGLKDKGLGVLGCDLHNTLFNEDYFIIGYYNAEQFLNGCEDGIFGAINIIKEYEQDNFGEVSTDLSSSEKVANMYAYIKGEELLNESDHLRERWDDELSQEDIDKIIEELENH